MPTTKKKLGSIGLFTRQADGSLGGASKDRDKSKGGSRRKSTDHAPPDRPTQLPQLQPPPEIVSSRQDRGRDQQQQSQPTATTTTMSLPPPHSQQHLHPVQRTLTSASDTARERPRGHNAWEDSTVASMFGDNESRAASDRFPMPPEGPPRRSQQSTRSQPKHDENLPFVIGEGGILKVIPPPSTRRIVADAVPAPLATSSTSGGIFESQSVKQEDAYQDGREAYETPTKNGLRRTKLAYRDNRDVRSNASSERRGRGYSPESQSLHLSPDKASESGDNIHKIRRQERLARERERQREQEKERERERQREVERELLHKRSTLFENLTPMQLDDPDFNNTKAAVAAPSTGVDADALKEALETTHEQIANQPRPFSPLQHLPRRLAPKPLGRTNNRRVKQESATMQLPATTYTATPNPRKRRSSLDYNDAELHAMSFSDLRTQPFDFDPCYQLAFCGQLSLDEWDEAGDWFLAQFGDVVARLRKARRAKRQMVQRFEGEVAAREEADFKEEGRAMMQ
ncbi:hypothetical protein N0V88_005004 [Collariella sp. IMI 366227]|nr:hypothetical protein N0V88_005004 [Collariella sp. IMI 366227]